MKQEFNENWSFRSESGRAGTVTLPHDAMLGETRRKDAAGKSASGYFPGGSYTYKKEFTLTAAEAKKHLTFEFEGVYKNAIVRINGKEAGRHAYGYSGFTVVADDFVTEGKNTVTVACDNADQPDSRWYSGAGIYRPVWFYVQEKECYLEHEGIRIRTTSIDPPTVEVAVAHEGGNVQIEILDGETVLAKADGDSTAFPLQGAALWSEETPKLYTARVTLFAANGTAVETETVDFGIRDIKWSAKGLFINGQSTLLRGGCIHSDNGVIGARSFAESEERRIRILKENGFNAVRISHNPAAKSLLDACDRLGMYVMDETWDMWYRKKSKFDYANDFPEHYKDDLKDLVAKDYNHPSVVLYSIGNEVSEPAEEKGVALAKEMRDLLHELDPSRPVTGGFNLMIIANASKGKQMYSDEGSLNNDGEEKMSGMNSTMFNMIASMVGTGMNKAANGSKADAATSPILDTVDVAGYNYASGRYPREGTLHPDRVILGSETFPQDLAKNWEMVKKYPYLVGDFMWTAWDYLGEAGIGAWSYHQDAKGFNKPYPWLLADTGAFDILGDPNGEALWAKAIWGKTRIALAVQPPNHPNEKLVKAVWRGTNAVPSWSWRGCEGNPAVVEVYTTAPVVELTLNGKRIGRKKTKDCRAVFKTKYRPGTLSAKAIDSGGATYGETELRSAEEKLFIRLTPEEEKGGTVRYLRLAIADAKGEIERNADATLSLTVENGELLGFGSANPRTEERFDAGTYTTYYGRAQAIIRRTGDGPVRVRCVDKSGNYQSQECVIS